MLRKAMTIKGRLITLLAFLSLMLMAIGSLGIYGMNRSNEDLLLVHQSRTVPSGQIADIRALVMRNRMLVFDAVNDPSPAVIRSKAGLVAENRQRASQLWQAYVDRDLGSVERQMADNFEASRQVFIEQGLNPTIAGLQAGRLEEAFKIAFEVMDPAFEPVLNAADRLMAYQVDQAQRDYEEATGLFTMIRGITVAAVLIAILLAVMVGSMIMRAIMVPLSEAVRVADNIARGDLTDRIEPHSDDEIGGLLDAMQRMSDRLRQLVQEVTESSLTVASEARQIAAGNVSLSQRTEEQASSLEQTASAMEQMTATVRQSAENASHANHLAGEARDSAEKGGMVVSSAVTAMNDINESSKQVADIIGVIDEIAFQTNLLALNAAVEAARAGEQGRGFAVVATEVRNLAQRSASAAKEIKALIQDSVEKVNQGTTLVEHSGLTLNEIIERVSKVTEIVAEIAAASEEQSCGIEEVNRAVMQLDELTQQNAAMVEEATASSQAQADLANSLHQLVSQYRVSSDASSAGAAARPREVTAAALPVERRGANRPWTGPGRDRRSAPTAASATARAATGTDDAEWEEF
ncbi:MAG: methyl-accepting chemotaxis protein [Pseudomonadales bacterium]